MAFDDEEDPPVSAIMSREVFAVTADLPLERLIVLLVDKSINGAPVVDDLGRPIGMVSKSDLVADDFEWASLRQKAEPWKKIAGERVGADDELFAERMLGSQTVADIMSPGLLSIHESQSIGHAAAVMVAHHVHQLPVTDEEGVVVGIVTTFDLTRWMAERLGALGPHAHS